MSKAIETLTPEDRALMADALGEIDAFATAEQGTKAESATQPGDLAAVAMTGSYNDLLDRPALGSAAEQPAGTFASAAQGAKADSALQAGAGIDQLADSPDFKRMTAAERAKVAGIEAGAQVNVVVAVAGKTGAVALAKADVGLGNVNNTSDADKPVSTATAAALAGKASAAQGAKADSALQAGAGIDQLADTPDYKRMTAAERAKVATIEAGAQVNAVSSVAGKTGAVALAKADVGLGNVNNTSDADKPVSTATAAALAGKASAAQGAKADSALQAGAGIDQLADSPDYKRMTAAERAKLAALDATADANKPVSTAQAAAIALVAEGAVQTQGRPGDAGNRFTSGLTGAASTAPAAPGVPAVSDESGAVLRVTGASVVGLRERVALDPLRNYRVALAAVRSADPEDPSGDTIRFGIQWLNKNKAQVSQRVIADVTAKVVSGRLVHEVLIGASAEGVDYAWPATARYMVPFVQTYGLDGVTDIQWIEWSDVTAVVAAAQDAASAVHPGDGVDALVETGEAKIMTAAERAKVAGIEAGAQVNVVLSVAGKTGAIALAKDDVGLGNVNNVADLDKPVSTAQAVAIDEAATPLRAATNEPEIWPDFDGLAWVELDALGRFSWCRYKDGTEFIARAGQIVMVSLASVSADLTQVESRVPAIDAATCQPSIFSGDLDGWERLELDEQQRFSRGRTYDLVDYAARAGTIAQELPARWIDPNGAGDWMMLDLVKRADGSFAFWSGVDTLERRWEPRGGEIMPVGNLGRLKCAVAYGDSTTYGDELNGAGAGWEASRWTALLPLEPGLAGLQVWNRGANGQIAAQITARAGGIFPTVTVTGGVIPASGPVELTGPSVALFLTNYVEPDATYDLMTDDGTRIRGVLKTNSAAFTFTRLSDGPAKQAATADLISITGRDDLAMHAFVGMGVNDEPASGKNTPIDEVKSYYRSFTAACKGGFTVWGMLDRGVSEQADNKTMILAIEAWLRLEYGAHYCPVRPYLSSARALADAALVQPGFVATANDLAAVAAGWTPPSFRFSGVHLNALGHKMQARFMARYLRARFNV